MLIKERYAEPVDALVTADLGGAVYDVEACDIAASGKVTLRGSITHHGWRLARRLNVTVAPQSGTTRVSVTDRGDGEYGIYLTGPASATIRVYALSPSTEYHVILDDQSQTATTDATGVLTIDAPAGDYHVYVSRSDPGLALGSGALAAALLILGAWQTYRLPLKMGTGSALG